MIGWVMKNARITSAPQINRPVGTFTFIINSRETLSRSITFFKIRGMTTTLMMIVRAAAM